MRAPGPAGLPLVGSLVDLLRAPPHAYFLECARTYGEVVRLRFGRTTAHLITGPDAIKRVLLDNGKNYTKQTRGWRNLAEAVGDGLLTTDGEPWLRQRRIAQVAFGKDKIAAFAPAIVAAAEARARAWSSLVGTGRPVDVAEEMTSLALEIVGATLLGTNLERETREVGGAMGFVQDRLSDIFALPLVVPTPQNRRYRAAVRTLDRVVRRIIAERRATADGAASRDLLGALMAARDEGTGEAMTDGQLRNEVLAFFAAGHETTAAALTWTFYLLSKHPTAARTMKAELDAVLAGRAPTAADVKALTYTRRVVDEAMRLYPPVWNLPRKAVADDELGGYAIPAGSLVFMCPYVAHRDPSRFPNPEGFDPERFATPMPRFAYFPFGGGPHLCIGAGFAILELVLVVATLAQRFRLDLTRGQDDGARAAVTLAPRAGMVMTVHHA